MPNNFTQVLIAESGSGYGGTAKYLADLLPVLKEKGISARVLSYGMGPFLKRLKDSGWPFEYKPEWKFPAGGEKTERWGLPGLLIAGGFQMLTQVPGITRWLRENEIGLVHLNNEILTHLPLLYAAKRAGCRVVCHLHGWREMTRLERLAVKHVDTFVCISHTGADYFSKQLGRGVVPAPNGIVIGPEYQALPAKRRGVREKWKIAENEILVSLIGRVISWKGQDVFLKALSLASREAPGLRGLILGKDTSPGEKEWKRLQELARELGVHERVVFLPWLEDVASAYAASDIVVHASVKPEPFGLVILEAMAAGRPVIATRAGGVVDIVEDGVSGLLIEPGSAEALAGALLKIVRDPEFAARISAAGEARVREVFTMEKNAAIIAGVYEQLLSRN